MQKNIFILLTFFYTILPAVFYANNGCFVDFIEHEHKSSVDWIQASAVDSPFVDSLFIDSLLIDTLVLSDSLKTDSASVNKKWYLISADSLDAVIDYQSADSIVYDIDSGKTYIYFNGEINYLTFHLEADYIEFDWSAKTLIAKRISDSTGIPLKPPFFQEGEETFNGDTLIYNFESKKGKIFYFKRQEGDGYITVQQAKMLENNSYFGSVAHYTTCELDHPHFYISTKKAKIVPKKLAVTGPANLVIADVPTPVFLPFGIFPFKKGQTSGLIIPQYGNHFSRGYFLRDGGYYFALSDHYDLQLTGDIYTRGSWGLRANSNYVYRYRFSGNLNVSYSVNKDGLEFTPDYAVNRGFFVSWRHSQDPKARPNSTFSASVNAGTSDYLSNNSYNATYLTNTLSSSISYTKRFQGTPFTLTTALRHDQSTSSKIVNLTLPDFNLSMDRIYPLKNVIKNKENPLSQLGITYGFSGKNFISSPDSTLFNESALGRFENGFSHNFSASTPVKLFKYFTFTPSFSYNENWFFQTIRKNYDPQTIYTTTIDPITGEEIIDTTYTYVRIDTIQGFESARFYNVSTSLSTKLYALAQFNSKLKAIRHVFTPTVSFSYRPDFSEPQYGYYGTYYPAPDAEAVKYSIFEGGLYGTPPSGKSGTVSFNLGNNLEMKVYSKKDSITHEKKIKIIESFSLGSSYNLAVDSLNWGNISMSGYSTFFEKLRFNYSATFDPYVLGPSGFRINKFEWDENNRIGRFNSANVSIGTSLKGARKENPNLETTSGTEEERQMVWDNPNYYIDFEIPWSFTPSYILRITNSPTADGRDSLYTTQTFTFQGDISISPKWKVQVTSGYDFELKDFSYTSVDIYRDLHCWEMSFKWIPFGTRQSYLFNINVKAGTLQSLKLTRKKDWSEY